MSDTCIRIPLPEGFTVRDLYWLLERAEALRDWDWREDGYPDDVWDDKVLTLYANGRFGREDVRRFRDQLRRRKWDVEPDYEPTLAWIDGTAIPFPEGFTVRDLAWLEEEVARILRDCDIIPHPETGTDADIVWYPDCLRIYIEIDEEHAKELREALRAHDWDVRPDFETALRGIDSEEVDA